MKVQNTEEGGELRQESTAYCCPIWFLFSNELHWTMMEQQPFHIALQKLHPVGTLRVIDRKIWSHWNLKEFCCWPPHPGFHRIYLFKEEWSPLITIYLLCPSASAVGDLEHSCSVSGSAVAVYLLLFLAQLSMLSERCASLPRRKWPFNELVKDLNYPRTWEKAF